MKNSTKLLVFFMTLLIILLTFFSVFFNRVKTLMSYMNTEIDNKDKLINHLERQVDILGNYK